MNFNTTLIFLYFSHLSSFHKASVQLLTAYCGKATSPAMYHAIKTLIINMPKHTTYNIALSFSCRLNTTLF